MTSGWAQEQEEEQQEELTYEQWVGNVVGYAKVCQKFFNITYEGDKPFHVDKMFAHSKEYNDQLLALESEYRRFGGVTSSVRESWVSDCNKYINESLDYIINKEKQ